MIFILRFYLLTLFLSVPTWADTTRPDKLRVVMDDNYPPYIMRKPDGSLEGYLVDAWNLWQQKTGITVEIIAQDWQTAQHTMANGEADVIDTIFETPQRKKQLDFGKAYQTLPVAIYYETRLSGIKDVTDLHGFQVGVKAGDACIDYLKADGITDLKAYPSYQSLLQALLNKKIHLFCMDEPPANYLIIRAHADHHVRKAFTLGQGAFHRAVHKGDTATLALVEKGFNAFSSAELQQLHDKWLGKTIASPLYRYLFFMLLGAAIFILLLLIISFLLRRMVKRRTADLVAAKAKLQATLDAIPDLLLEVDRNGFFLDYHSSHSNQLICTAENFLGKAVTDVLPPAAAQTCLSAIQEAHENGYSQGKQIELSLAGGVHWFELSVAPKQDVRQAIPSFIMLSHDITSRKTAALKIEHLSRLYEALSQCNQAIMRCHDETELFPILCQHAINFGGMSMAWVGLVDETTQLVKPAAAFGHGIEYLDTITISVQPDKSMDCGPVGTAIRENHPVWCQDFLRQPDTAPWHERAAIFGWQAMAVLPLHCKGKVVGAFSLYVDRLNAFDEETKNLLIEMALDISYALDHFASEAARKQAELDRERSEEKYRTLFESSRDAIMIVNAKGRFIDGNPAAIEMFGLPDKSTLLTLDVWHCSPEYQADGMRSDKAVYDKIQQIKTKEELSFEWYFKRQNGEKFPAEVQLIWIELAGEMCVHTTVRDVSAHKQAEARIQQLAYFDPLTGLPNRAQLTDRLKSLLRLAERNQEPLAVIFLDLDHFKDINDSLGHDAGDQLLIELSHRFKSVLREEDILSRLGGDEFILVLPETDEYGARKVATKLMQAHSQPCIIQQHELTCTVSMGIAIYPDDGQTMETLLKNADTAMYKIKQTTRNGFCFFTESMQKHSIRTLRLLNALHHALDRNQLQLHYQPQIDLSDGRIIGAEALLRWHHPEMGPISPAEFIPIAEKSGLIIQIGEWVLRSAARQLKDWHDQGLPPIILAVNLSIVQFRHPSLTDLVAEILHETKLPPQYLELELTESIAMDEPEKAITVINKLHQQGIRLSIDDFGTGYSSMSYLKKFNVHKLKIDQSFIRDISIDADDKAIVQAIITLAQSLSMQTIAEGVETTEQMAFLRHQGCDEAQGYFISKPLPLTQFEHFLRNPPIINDDFKSSI